MSVKDPRSDGRTTVGVAASDRVVPVYPARVESPPTPVGAVWIALAVLAILLFLSFGLIWLFGRR